VRLIGGGQAAGDETVELGGGACGWVQGRARLERIGGAIDWSELDPIMSELRSAAAIRPGWPTLMTLKAPLLAKWRRLPDPRSSRLRPEGSGRRWTRSSRREGWR
jgi:hypothetical protein